MVTSLTKPELATSCSLVSVSWPGPAPKVSDRRLQVDYGGHFFGTRDLKIEARIHSLDSLKIWNMELVFQVMSLDSGSPILVLTRAKVAALFHCSTHLAILSDRNKSRHNCSECIFCRCCAPNTVRAEVHYHLFLVVQASHSQVLDGFYWHFQANTRLKSRRDQIVMKLSKDTSISYY